MLIPWKSLHIPNQVEAFLFSFRNQSFHCPPKKLNTIKIYFPI
jgi:hypothetical protein